MKQSFDYTFLFRNKQKTARVAVIILLILATLFLFLFQTGNNDEKEITKTSNPDDVSSVKTDYSDEFIVVDVSGEVKSPSVIELPLESRINDAIEAAGGLTIDADISQINRAAPIADGEKIFIPKKMELGDQKEGDAGQNTNQNIKSPNDAAQTDKININQAESSKLQEIPGIGPVTADKIISYRMEHGLFRKLEDLKKVSGIGDKTFEKMQAFICI